MIVKYQPFDIDFDKKEIQNEKRKENKISNFNKIL